MNLMRTVVVAHATLDAIDACIAADGGAAFRQHLGRIIPHMDDAFRGQEDEHRSHMGASFIGRDCARSIWYKFRWSVGRGGTEPRMLRLFNRGHLEEARFIAMLLAIGAELWFQDAEGNQFRISHAGGHFGGSGDGVTRGIPDLPATTAAVCEFKTHNEKSFIKLAGKLDDWRACRAKRGPFTGEGVRLAKFEHFVQMQVYMRKMGLAAGLYMAVCKNTDDLYAEVVVLDPDFADQFLQRGEQLVFMQEPPKRINESPGFFKCRFCDEHAVCHKGQAPTRSCRSCCHVGVVGDGTWRCGLTGAALDKAAQKAACSEYRRAF